MALLPWLEWNDFFFKVNCFNYDKFTGTILRIDCVKLQRKVKGHKPGKARKNNWLEDRSQCNERGRIETKIYLDILAWGGTDWRMGATDLLNAVESVWKSVKWNPSLEAESGRTNVIVVQGLSFTRRYTNRQYHGWHYFQEPLSSCRSFTNGE